MFQKCERFKIPFPKVLKKIMQDVGFDDMAMTQVYQARLRAPQYLNDITGNVEINLEEARLARRNFFTDIAVRHLG